MPVVSSPHDLQTILLFSSSLLLPGLLASISLFSTLQLLLFLLHPPLLSILHSSCTPAPLSRLLHLLSLLACLSSMVGQGRPRLIFLLRSPELQVLRMSQPPREQVCTQHQIEDIQAVTDEHHQVFHIYCRHTTGQKPFLLTKQQTVIL